jgi:hypothetical protein
VGPDGEGSGAEGRDAAGSGVGDFSSLVGGGGGDVAPGSLATACSSSAVECRSRPNGAANGAPDVSGIGMGAVAVTGSVGRGGVTAKPSSEPRSTTRGDERGGLGGDEARRAVFGSAAAVGIAGGLAELARGGAGRLAPGRGAALGALLGALLAGAG